MSNELIFYTQVSSILAYLGAVFWLYKLLVIQKDGLIQLQKEQIADRDNKILELKSRTPDALAIALSARIEMAVAEIGRLKNDGNKHAVEISQKEHELDELRSKLTILSDLIADSDLACEKCGAPLIVRTSDTITGYQDGHEVEADIEYREYGCGLTMRDNSIVTPCNRSGGNRLLIRP